MRKLDRSQSKEYGPLVIWAGDLIELLSELKDCSGIDFVADAAPDAVAYAIAYHRALATLNPPLKARAGLHVGPVILRENSRADMARGAKPIEAEGTAKALAARATSIANGGQTLLSADARNALGEITLRLKSHGHWRMKGIADPLELFEVGDADAPFVPPADAAKGYRVVRKVHVWPPAREIRHNVLASRVVARGPGRIPRPRS
jgi:class 3 adenylate cyclase